MMDQRAGRCMVCRIITQSNKEGLTEEISEASVWWLMSEIANTC